MSQTLNAYAMPDIRLPWSASADEDTRFNKILGGLFVVFVVVSVVVTLMKVPELTRAEKEQLPPQLARVVLERQELPQVKVEPPKVEEKKPEEKKREEKPKEKAPVKVEQKPLDSSKDVKTEAKDRAREQAAAQISTFKDDLMEMREALQSTSVENAQADVLKNDGPQAQVDRSMINSGVTKGSGGINVGAMASHDTGGVALSGRETTKVKSGLADASKKAQGATGTGGGNSNGSGGAARSEEEIRKVMEQHKGSIFAIYNRALRENASLQGKVVVKMVIDPSGRIADVTIVSSELKDPDLEAKLLQRIKLITFSASNVEKTTLNYSFDFLPQ